MSMTIPESTSIRPNTHLAQAAKVGPFSTRVMRPGMTPPKAAD
jgi:hypothetical protein